MSTNPSSSFPRPAFTLVELLVVIGIIGLLIALLLPALSRARASANSIACLNNLRQMAIAAQSYANEFQGRYPIAYYHASDGPLSITYAWDLTTTESPSSPPTITPGLLWRSADPTRIQQCPSYEGPANWLTDPYTGYNYNTSFIGHGQFESTPSPIKVSSVHHPSTVALFGDAQWAGGANKFMRAPFPNPGDASFTGRYAGTQGYRHRSRTNVAFCDTHAESLKDRHTQNADDATAVAPNTGFLSSDNRAYDPR